MNIKILIIYFVLGCFVLGIFIYGKTYYTDYHLKLSETTVKDFLEDFMDSSIEVVQFEQIEETNTWLVHLKINNNQYGHARFNEGWNHKLKFIYITLDPSITYREYKTNKGNYGTLYVNDLDSHIGKIKLTSQWLDFEKEIEVSTSTPFMKTFKLPKHVEDTFPATFTFYDKMGEIYP